MANNRPVMDILRLVALEVSEIHYDLASSSDLDGCDPSGAMRVNAEKLHDVQTLLVKALESMLGSDWKNLPYHGEGDYWE